MLVLLLVLENSAYLAVRVMEQNNCRRIGLSLFGAEVLGIEHEHDSPDLIMKIAEDRRITIQGIACRPSDPDFHQRTDMARLAFEDYNFVTACTSYETLWIRFAWSLT